jgi:hypothetical protein
MLAVEAEFGMTVKFVVMLLSQSAAFGITVMYVPEVVSAEPPGGV